MAIVPLQYALIVATILPESATTGTPRSGASLASQSAIFPFRRARNAARFASYVPALSGSTRDSPATMLAVIVGGLAAIVVVNTSRRGASRALQLAQRGYVMDSGEVTMSGDAQALLNDPKVRAAYLGE